MDENKNTPEGVTPTPETAPATPSAPMETPSAPAAAVPPAAPTPAQAGYEAQYAAQPTPTGQPMPGAPMPTGQPMPGAPMPTAPISPTPALVCGILSIVFCGIPIVGIILGIVAIVLAGKYIKAGGTQGTAKGGRICGIVGIVLSAIMIIITCVLVVFTLNELRDYQADSSYASSVTTEESASTAATEEEEAAIYAAVDPSLEQIKNQDPEMVATVAAMMEEELNDALAELDITLADCGVDSLELAAAMMDGFDYEPYYASVEGATAEANYLVTVRDNDAVSEAFYDRIVEIFEDVERGSMAEAEVYQIIGQELMAAVQGAAPEPENFWDVDLANTTGSWVMDSESWDEELQYFFTLH